MEDDKKVVYEYLCENYLLPYTGAVEIDKTTRIATLIKAADNEISTERAVFYAGKVLPAEGYPSKRTHTAI